MAGVDFFGTFPALHPGWLMFIYIVVPWIPILIGVNYVSKETHWRGGRVYSFCCNLVLFLYRFAPIMVVALLFLSTIMLINQASYAYRHLSLNRNPSYFLSVDLPSFDILKAINSVTVDNSYNQITALAQGGSRRLQASMAVDTTLTLTYHTSDFTNLATSSFFTQMCQTELAILKDNTTCINKNRYDSLLPQFYRLPQSCTPVKSPVADQLTPILSRTKNSRFVQQPLDTTNPETAIVSTYFDIGTCADTFSPSEFSDYLQRYVSAASGGGDLHITYTSASLNRDDVDNAIKDAGYYLMVAGIVCAVILFLFQRGIIMSLVTMFCFFFSLINAAAFLSLLDFEFFSFLNAG